MQKQSSSVASEPQRWWLLAVCVVALSGCGTDVVLPEPRKVVDEDEEERPTVVKTAPLRTATEQTTSQQPPRQPPSRAPQPKASNRAQAVHNAVNRAIQGQDPDETSSGPVRRSEVGADNPDEWFRPADLTAWTPNDFRTAKDDSDIRLLQAVALLGQRSSDADAHAKLLIELLDEPPPLPAPGLSQPSTPPSMRGLAQAIVAALVTNRSATANDAIKQIVLGELRTTLDDRTFTVELIKGLVGQGGFEADALVYAILTMPGTIRPSGRSVFTADAMQKECVTLVREAASSELRLRLAEFVGNPSTSAADRALLLPMLLEPRIKNLPAQRHLALAVNFDSNQRTNLQRNVLTQARRAVDILMATPDTGQLHASDDAAIRSVFAARSPELLQESHTVIDVFWSPAVIDLIAKRLNELPGPREQPDLWALATSTPSDDFRTLLRKELADRWLEADALLRSTAFSPTAMRDPGMLLVLKSLPREGAAARQPTRGRGNPAQQQRLAQERKARLAWHDASQKLMTTLMRRFHIAGEVVHVAAAQPNAAASPTLVKSVADLNRLLEQQGNRETIEPSSGGNPAAGFPLELPAAAELVTSYSLRWPEDLEGQMTSLAGSLVVHYARLRWQEQGQRAVAHFARQLKGATEHAVSDGVWVDSASRPALGKLRSIDALVTLNKDRPTVAAGNKRDVIHNLVVELLWIEIDDFLETENAKPGVAQGR